MEQFVFVYRITKHSQLKTTDPGLEKVDTIKNDKEALTRTMKKTNFCIGSGPLSSLFAPTLSPLSIHLHPDGSNDGIHQDYLFFTMTNEETKGHGQL